MMEIKRKDFADLLPVMPSQTSLWIMGSRIYGEGRTQIPEFTHYDRFSGTRSRIDRVYTDIKIVGNTKINQIMVCFTGLYNAIYIDRLRSKTKIRKIHETLIILFVASPSYPQLPRIGSFH